MSLTNKKDWFKVAIDSNICKSFKYSSISDIRVITNGAFNSVFSAYLKRAEKFVVLKSLHDSINKDENSFNEFVRECRFLTSANFHDNIIKFFGITQETYYMILQFANNGNLQTYLHYNFLKLDWITKIKMAKDITSGIQCLHDENIVHQNLVRI
ncbi:35116_t:CDS:2 [Gigaspora margarita]|uniref:35116_t:CDS:1 n=1 Tax=Gigaspora margarita TaxID=4874 RepID=A0ABN7VNL2_GIGMA|nr:35116_t:CDS:2 [Gigaspora margarita]